MKVIMFGSKGLIGRTVCRVIENQHEEGWECIGVDLDTHPQFMHDGDIHFTQLIYTLRPDAVVNCTYPRDYMEHIRVTVDISLSAVAFFLGQGHGNLINFGSIYGVVGPNPALYDGLNTDMPLTYSFVKGGTIAFTRSIATKYGRDGIRANCISPGGVIDSQSEEFIERYEDRTPDGTMAIPEDISGVVKFLLSNDSQYITGQNIIVDGGYTAW